MPRLKLITFDLDNTLWDVESIILGAEEQMISWLQSNTPDAMQVYNRDTLPVLREKVVAEFPDKRHDLSFMRTEVLYKVMRTTGYESKQARALAKQAFEVFFAGRNNVKFFPGALELLERLQTRYVLYALTNGNADIRRTGLDSYLAGAISSADVGASKPDAAMFQRALRTVDSQPHEAVHVGDHLVDDVEGAHNAGMHTVWLNLSGSDTYSAKHPPTEVVTELAQIEQALLRIEEC